MSKWHCELSETDYDTYEEAYDACLEHIQPWEYWGHVHDIEPSRLFEALTNPETAQEVLEEIVQTTEQQYVEWYVHEYEEDEEDEENENI